MGIRLLVLVIISITLTGCWPFDSDDSSSPSPVSYTAEFIEPSPPNLYPCDGTITLPKTLFICKNNSGQVVDNINCSHILIPQATFKSPAGEQIDPLANDYIEIIGDRTFTCEEGKNRAQSTVVVSCSDDRYKLKGEYNKRDSFCKHFPVRMQLSTNLTCIEFSDAQYECTGSGLNVILKDLFTPDWGPSEYNYLRELSYFKGYEKLTFNRSGGFAIAIKDNKTIGRVTGSILSSGNTGLDAIEIKTGDYGNSYGDFICYIGIDRKLYCKGDSGSFGYPPGGTIYNQIPNLENLNKLYVSNNTCVQELDGTVYCAGVYRPGLGDEDPEEYWVPFLEVPGFFNAKELHLNQYNTCAITQENKLVCAGTGFAASSTPREIAEFQGLTSFTLGYDNTCGVINSKLYCVEYFNDNSSFREIESFSGVKQVFSTKDNSSINNPNFVSESNLCGIMENNDVKCVGTNEDYELGVGDNNPRMEPVVIWEF